MEDHLVSLLEAKEVSPSLIQKELHKIWESFQATKVTRACLFNLIFYTQKDHRFPYIQKLISALVEKFPARVILIITDPSTSTNTLKTSVAILQSSKGDISVACDFIQIEASGNSKEQIPFLLLPHLLPDLPVYTIFGEDPAHKEPLFVELEKFSHRLIFDSESTENLAGFAKKLLSKYVPGSCDIADLNWARMESWRDIFTNTFYSKEKLHALETCSSLKITYNAQHTPFFSHTKIQALYLLAWLATQLKWSFEEIRSTTLGLELLYTHKAGSVTCLLASETLNTIPPGLILSVDLETQNHSHFHFATNLDAIHEITLYSSTPGSCELPCRFLFSKVALGHSLVNEIYHKGTSSHFLKTLELLQTLNIPNLC